MVEEENKVIDAVELAAKRETRKKRLGFVIMMIVTFASLFAFSAGTFTWFLIQTQDSTLSAVSGELGVVVNKIVAYKYVYPFFTNSTEFIDYDATGTVKGYVVEDASLEATSSSYSVTASFPLTQASGSYLRGDQDEPAYNKIEYEESQDFMYYIVGDATFNANAENPWSTLNSVPFASKSALATYVSSDIPATVVVENIVVSAGATFTLFDRSEAKSASKWHYLYGDPIENNPRFELVKDGNDGVAIKCLKSGIYRFSHYSNRLVIDYTPRQTPADDTLIGGSILDPTQIKLDWDGREHTDPDYQTEGQPDISKYLPVAVQQQNTMVVLDVELQYDNVNPIDAGLFVTRKGEDANRSITRSGGYDDSTHHITGGTEDLLNASDFYSFYAVFTDEAHKYSLIEGEGSLWEAMHQRTDIPVGSANKSFAHFVNDSSNFDPILPIAPQLKDITSSTIPSSPLANEKHLSGIYHWYVAVDYDYSRAHYFLNENRLGKTFYLQRDFGFRFTASGQGEQA